LRIPAEVAWGGSMIIGLAMARAVTRFAVLRLRAAGLEMAWRTAGRSLSTARGTQLEIRAEPRNRELNPVRFTALRGVAASPPGIQVEPKEGEVPAGGALELLLRVETPRVGRHGIHGLALEIQGPREAFEVPLAFASPLGVAVLPRPYIALSA